MEIIVKKLKQLKPYENNPRNNDEAVEYVANSIQEFGFKVPIIIDNDNVIVTGHTRYKASQLLGLDEVPCIVADDLTDEQIKAFRIADNKVVFSCEYVYACKMLNIDVNCYICNDNKMGDIDLYFNQDYGQYSYEDLEKNTYVQGLAQMNRTTEHEQKKVKRRNKSSLYETMVIPYIQNNEVKTILDFGCGKGAYINMLSKNYNALGVEFYNNNGKDIIVSKGNRMIDNLVKYLQENRTFDVVVCDSVLNSVHSVKAEKSVMACLNLFTNHIAFISGRPNKYEIVENAKKQRSFENNRVYFLDENGFTANYREGKWYYQKFHTEQQIKKLFEENGFEIKKLVYGDNSWQVECKKVRNLSLEEYIEAIDFEFNLILPNGKSYNRHDEIKEVLGLI